MIQDKDLNYLFATNEGIYHFDYYHYKKIECDAAKSNTVFNFIMDQQGFIYCHNLNNQIFKITGSDCKIIYELQPNESKSDISLAIGNDDLIIIGAAKLIVLDKNGTVVSRQSINNHSLGPAFTNSDKNIQFHLTGTDSIVCYSKGKFSSHPLMVKNEELNDATVFKFFNINRESYAYDLKTGSLYQYNSARYHLNRMVVNRFYQIEGAARIYEAGDNIWAAGTFPGVLFFRNDIAPEVIDFFYKDYFISNVYKDREGNILLSTFDKGVLVIPDLEIPDVMNAFSDDPVTALHADPVKGIIMGTSQGKLMYFLNDQINVITEGGKHPIEGIYGNANSELIIFDNGFIRAYNKRTGRTMDLVSSSLKDAAIVSDEEFYLGTNNGIIKAEWQPNGTYYLWPLNEISQRIYSLEYNPVDKCLYASTANGLFRVFASGSTKKITYANNDIFPDDLHCYEGKIFASTKKNGILVIENEKVISSIVPMVNGNKEALKKIIIYNKSIIGNSANGLFQFDMNGKLLRSIHASYGFTTNRVLDFTFDNKRLWVSHSGGVQQIDLTYTKSNSTPPMVRFDQINVNDQPTDLSKKGNFKNDQRKIQFIFSSPTLRNRETIVYHYKLMGYDKEWNSKHYEFNEVTYNALAPGNYTFQLKVENQGQLSPVLSYTFTIAKPIYANAWFIALAIVLFLGIVYMIYRWQLSIQNKKAKQLNELNASKLTAIQSQMNPHFIFNSLNSIQDLILKGDVEHSYSYITTFSNLVRRTLSYSEKDFIDFEQELKLLELYLSLEKLRYKKDLHYNIEVKDVEDIVLPPLLIQPFIENALVHGLLHKEGEKKLKISFELKDSLICTIEDNGIGREQAKTIKQRQRSDHESFSGKAIHKRFEILSNVFKGRFGYIYEDLYENNQPAGTKVTLTIPIKRKF